MFYCEFDNVFLCLSLCSLCNETLLVCIFFVDSTVDEA